MRTKIAVVVRDDLMVWQKMNVTAFLTSGLVSQYGRLIGAPYVDESGVSYNAMLCHPVFVYSAAGDLLAKCRERSNRRGVTISAYVDAMFGTSNDNDNRRAFAETLKSGDALVGIAVVEDGKVVDKITKGAKRHD